jgi:hypothetical protein
MPQRRRCNQKIEIAYDLSSFSQRPTKLAEPLTDFLIETENDNA